MSGFEIPACQQSMSGHDDHFSDKVSVGWSFWLGQVHGFQIKLITGQINLLILNYSVIYENSYIIKYYSCLQL